jgi:hypothetical protein
MVTPNKGPVAELSAIRPRPFVSRAYIAEAALRASRIDHDRFRADLDRLVAGE